MCHDPDLSGGVLFGPSRPGCRHQDVVVAASLRLLGSLGFADEVLSKLEGGDEAVALPRRSLNTRPGC